MYTVPTVLWEGSDDDNNNNCHKTDLIPLYRTLFRVKLFKFTAVRV